MNCSCKRQQWLQDHRLSLALKARVWRGAAPHLQGAGWRQQTAPAGQWWDRHWRGACFWPQPECAEHNPALPLESGQQLLRVSVTAEAGNSICSEQLPLLLMATGSRPQHSQLPSPFCQANSRLSVSLCFAACTMCQECRSCLALLRRRSMQLPQTAGACFAGNQSSGLLRCSQAARGARPADEQQYVTDS